MTSVRQLLRQAKQTSTRSKLKQDDHHQEELVLVLDSARKSYGIARVLDAPDRVAIIQEFVTPQEEMDIVSAICKGNWQRLRHRRAQMLGGDPGSGEIRTLPKYLEQVIDLVAHFFPADCRPNHVLINEYLPEQFIMPHKDGPLYYPFVAILSLDADSVFKFSYPVDYEGAIEFPEIDLPRRSLLLFSENAYSELLHFSINHSTRTRYSITMRFVMKN
jgi:alkylated DNA repair protein alkB family protein 6